MDFKIQNFKEYFIVKSDCKPKKPSLNARSDKDAEKLWFLSEKMVSLK